MNPFNTNSSVHLLENGLVVMLDGRDWIIRRYDPNETFDSKWDVWVGKSWGSTACLCFPNGAATYKTLQDAVEIARKLQ